MHKNDAQADTDLLELLAALETTTGLEVVIHLAV
jgi:hypothetical protein